MRPICANAPHWDCTLEEADDGFFAVRLGLRMVGKLPEIDGARLVLARAEDPYRSIDDLWRRAQVGTGSLSRLAAADAFRPSLRLARREAGWAIKGLRDTALPLFDQLGATELNEPALALKAMTEGREIVEDYGHIGLSLRRHPLALLRGELEGRGYQPC